MEEVAGEVEGEEDDDGDNVVDDDVEAVGSVLVFASVDDALMVAVDAPVDTSESDAAPVI